MTNMEQTTRYVKWETQGSGAEQCVPHADVGVFVCTFVCA